MKHRKIVTLGCALALSTAPFAAMAYTTESALNACAAAVTKDLSNDELAWRLDEESKTGGRLRGTEVIHLDVRDAASDEILARAYCVVDERARVKRVKTLPLDAADAEERALTAY
jgi:hypothetical protein